MNGSVEVVFSTLRTIGHSVPDDLIYTVCNDCIGEQFKVSHVFFARVLNTRDRFAARKPIDAGKRLATYDVSALHCSGRRRNSRKVGIEQEGFRLWNVYLCIGAQQIDWRAVTLNTRKMCSATFRKTVRQTMAFRSY